MPTIRLTGPYDRMNVLEGPGGGVGLNIGLNASVPEGIYEVPLNKPVTVPDEVVSLLEDDGFQFTVVP